MNRNCSQPDERTFFATFGDGLRYRRRACGERFREFRSRGYQRALTVVDDDAQHVLAVSEPLHQPLQFGVRDLARAGIPRRPLDVADETLPQHLGATLHITAQGALFSQYFVVGKTRRNQRDAENKRSNKANTQQAHAESFLPKILTRLRSDWLFVNSK